MRLSAPEWHDSLKLSFALVVKGSRRISADPIGDAFRRRQSARQLQLSNNPEILKAVAEDLQRDESTKSIFQPPESRKAEEESARPRVKRADRRKNRNESVSSVRKPSDPIFNLYALERMDEIRESGY